MLANTVQQKEKQTDTYIYIFKGLNDVSVLYSQCVSAVNIKKQLLRVYFKSQEISEVQK